MLDCARVYTIIFEQGAETVRVLEHWGAFPRACSRATLDRGYALHLLTLRLEDLGVDT